MGNGQWAMGNGQWAMGSGSPNEKISSPSSMKVVFFLLSVKSFRLSSQPFMGKSHNQT
jgi:hypothetical protein